MVIDFGTTWFLKDVLKIHKYVANSTGVIRAATSNFFLNRLWTFRSTNPAVLIQFSKFFFIAICGLLINNLIIYFFTDYKFKVNFYVSKGIATFIVFLWNFLMNYIFTF